MQMILISSCLLGYAVRYNGHGFSPESGILQSWLKAGRLIEFCPEVAGGLGVPRPAAEIIDGDGREVIEQRASVHTDKGEDVTAAYLAGAKEAVKIVQDNDIRLAVLKSKSPACGFGKIYDGSFSGKLIRGDGVMTAALLGCDIRIFNEFQLEQANTYLTQIESDR